MEREKMEMESKFKEAAGHKDEDAEVAEKIKEFNADDIKLENRGNLYGCEYEFKEDRDKNHKLCVIKTLKTFDIIPIKILNTEEFMDTLPSHCSCGAKLIEWGGAALDRTSTRFDPHKVEQYSVIQIGEYLIYNNEIYHSGWIDFMNW